ncbi:MAG: hypothetical protein M1832_003366 [Thelocarpon impressellum]|nr:MAG: hypothetical protein M1832_003366 [Thelocarpon impressellum]
MGGGHSGGASHPASATSPPPTPTSCLSRQPPETRFCDETVLEFGFDKVRVWERWALSQMWTSVFASAKYDPRDLAAAVRRRKNSNRDAVRAYVEAILPGLYPLIRQGFVKYLADATFPNLWGYMGWRGPEPPDDYCIIHRPYVSPFRPRSGLPGNDEGAAEHAED